MIYSRQISSLLILLLISLGMSSIKGYNTIYLMEFENIDKDKTIHQFERSLPSLVKENYKFRNDVNISYAADIHPYMDFNVDDPDAIKSLLIKNASRKGTTQSNEYPYFIATMLSALRDAP